MLTDEILSTLFIVGGFTALLLVIFLISKIPGSGLIFRLIRRLFLILWGIVVLCLTFFMFFMVGYMVIVFFTFNGSEEGILFQGEPVNFLIGDNAKYAAYFIMLYAGFCMVFVYVISFILSLGRKTTRTGRSFHAEAVLVIMLVLVFTVFPAVVEAVLPDFEVGQYGRYALGVVPITMYIQGQIKNVRERRGHGRYLSQKEQFYQDLDEKEPNRF
ncbi:hypothetical protein [Gracilibacillus alcaliphilus]|uniref:hypothetical protein n=1 Tax=Gracilibacillus alcaliphilus TaxID=1401441 RepID=UPI00195E12A0|nr:hypothetical protein [Gracilibacillus alcaliphilus]MBM7678763.1 hypothetical protein [Gracilibacillus alcaliphilus]